jgi:hypothetical protein
MKKIFYEKKGRRYVPVAEYNDEWLDSFPKGVHIVKCDPDGQSRRFNIDPAFAPMIAAGMYAQGTISLALMKASELRVPENKQPLTEEQRAAWEHLAKTFGRETLALEWPSYREAAEAGVQALQAEAEKLLTNETVRSAYENFMLVAKLSMENQ